jgi:dienelactone hydrolase
MGVGVIGALWPERLEAAAVFCLHAPTRVPEGVRPGTPVQLHVGGDDARFAPADQIAMFRDSAESCGARATVHQYPGVGHLFTDPSLPDFDAAASARTWAQVLQVLESL